MLARSSTLVRARLARPTALVCAPRLVRAQRELSTLFAASAIADSAAAVAATTEAAAPLVGPNATYFLAVSPAIAAQFLFLSPMQAMKQFRESGTTGDVSVMPYAAMAANGAAWFTYGALGSDFTIMVPNVSGLVFGSYYCHQFYTHRAPDATVLPYFGGGAAFVTATTTAAATLPVDDAKTIIGYAGCTLTALMFYGPLAAVGTVLKDKSAASLPLAFTLASTANCARPSHIHHDPLYLLLCFALTLRAHNSPRLLRPPRTARHAVDVVRRARHPRPIRVGPQRLRLRHVDGPTGPHCPIWNGPTGGGGGGGGGGCG